ncbi:unnamed protein product [Lactuca saligna]|uniref:Uncharacterized protein n=1 Tax=Lactuca saligna TaxID=75948 RepID=A0AA35UZX7_LACSI|nr:unnamed protein product [Lactuca saligna]
MVTIHDGGSSSSMGDGGLGGPSLSKRDVCNIIATAVSRIMLEDLPNIVWDELISVMYERIRTLLANLEVSQLRTREVTIKEFYAYRDPCFIGGGGGEPIIDT